MSKFALEKINRLEAYTPGEQPRDKKYIKLNTNESPFPPSPRVIKAVAEATGSLNLYPDPEAVSLKEAIAAEYGVNKDNVFVSNGSDEILSFVFMGLCPRGVCFPNITYGFYKVYAELYGVEYTTPTLKNFRIDVSDYLNANKTVVIANPNAPTGISLSLDEVESIVASNPDNVVCIDEAYVDFGGESAASLIGKYSNLIVARTFSKSRSMAGARLGYALASKQLIDDLNKIKYSTNPYNINRMTIVAGIEAIKDVSYFEQCRQAIIQAREYFSAELRAIGFSVLPSNANFVFAKSDRIGGKLLYTELRKRGFLVRHFSDPQLDDYNRISVGTIDDMKALLSAIKDILTDRGEINE